MRIFCAGFDPSQFSYSLGGGGWGSNPTAATTRQNGGGGQFSPCTSHVMWDTLPSNKFFALYCGVFYKDDVHKL
jgi:hypothetical protein